MEHDRLSIQVNKCLRQERWRHLLIAVALVGTLNLVAVAVLVHRMPFQDEFSRMKLIWVYGSEENLAVVRDAERMFLYRVAPFVLDQRFPLEWVEYDFKTYLGFPVSQGPVEVDQRRKGIYTKAFSSRKTIFEQWPEIPGGDGQSPSFILSFEKAGSVVDVLLRRSQFVVFRDGRQVPPETIEVGRGVFTEKIVTGAGSFAWQGDMRIALANLEYELPFDVDYLEWLTQPPHYLRALEERIDR